MADSMENHPAPPQATAAANRWLVMILVLLVGVLIFRTVGDVLLNRPDYTPRTVTPRGELAADEKSTIAVFQQAAPSVVFVRTKGFRLLRTMQEEETEEGASGTGFVWDETGHVITNLHVVLDALRREGFQLEIQFADMTVMDAEFVGAVAQHDIAVLKVNAKPSQLVPITIGTAQDLQVGQKVLAIGNPFGFDRTLSTGVIGGLNRSVATNGSSEALHGLIQTDAAINPGNSGGPLLDSSGRLIGVNTAIISNDGTSAGLGFAVPVEDVQASVELVLDQTGRESTPDLGIAWLEQLHAQQLGMTASHFHFGPIIRQVVSDSAADEAGLQGTRVILHRFQLGDQITAIDGVRVTSGGDLDAIVSEHKVGDEVVLDFIRQGRSRQVRVKLKAARYVF